MSFYTDVREAVPKVDGLVSRYVSGYVDSIQKNASQPETAQLLDLDAELDFVTTVLRSAGGEAENIGNLRSKLYKEIKVVYDKNVGRTFGNPAQRKLDLDTLMTALKSNEAKFDVGEKKMDLDLLADNKGRGESRVDRKKLAKQEKKIAAKLAKRENAGFMKELKYEKSKLLSDNNQKNYDEFFLTVNPLDLGPSEGKSKDIKIDNFDLHVGAGVRILSDASLTLAHGHRYGLVGANGIGKSTLLKALSRRELNVPKHITILYVEQEVTGDDTSVLKTVLDADVWRKCLLQDLQRINDRLAVISDEYPDANDQVQKQLDEEADDLNTNLNQIHEKLGDMESDKAEARAGAILSGLGFSLEAQGRATNTFSGGWRMRISLARALFCKPDLLMLDEPSNMLDLPSITFLSEYLLTYPSTVLVVSHDRAFLNDVATDIIYQHSERLDYYRGSNFDEFYSAKEERLLTAKREYENQMALRKHLQAFIDKFRYNAAKSQEAQSRIKKLEKLPVLEPPEQEADFKFSFPDPEKISPPVLQISGATFSYPDGRKILSDVDMTVDLDSRIALVGGNGSGKTTLLKLLLGTLQPQVGHVSRHPRLRIGYFAQHHVDAMDLSLNSVEWLASVRPGKSEEEYRKYLGQFGITGPLGLRKLGVLSGGQKSRVAFAALGLSNPHLLILDEPSNHLDIAALDALADALKNFTGGILMVSHDVVTINRVCKDIMVCENGKVFKLHGNIDDYKKHILKIGNKAGVVAEQ
ncbi:putative AAA family ATPase [Starmerella bacillaris]|uniref:AAA family ATPase n=1 Tax=Starmerella bacillaris TaxID=1247836 RepID=A0AAV5RGY6_STABA|nr:putative AAA family ATPase [Starmerella bacillaris]